MSLQDELDVIRAELGVRWPQFLLDIQRMANEAIASGYAEEALKAGAMLPGFRLIRATGEPISSGALLRTGPLIVIFYQGVWCPFNNCELRAFRALEPEIRARGVGLIAISPQLPKYAVATEEATGATYPLLYDEGGRFADACGLRMSVAEDLRATYVAAGADLPMYNGEFSWSVPLPARYVVGSDGIVAYCEVSPDPSRRTEPVQLLPLVDRLRRQRG